MASLTRWICYINGLAHNVYEWLFKQNTDILRLIHVIRYINSFFINKNEETALYFVLYIFHKLFVSSLIYTYFSTFGDYNFAKNYSKFLFCCYECLQNCYEYLLVCKSLGMNIFFISYG